MKISKRVLTLLLILVVALGLCSCGSKGESTNGNKDANVTPTKMAAPTRAPHNQVTDEPKFKPVSTPAAAPENTLTGVTSADVVKNMGMGWNLGNTFDSTGAGGSIEGFETSWGNPVVTQELIDSVAKAGYKSIRIPVTWYRAFVDKQNYVISEAYLARVKEVVDYAYNNDMYVILNVHHENWVNDKELDKNYEKIGNELYVVWTQISTYFADYDQHLIFEGMNEPRKAGAADEWGGDEASYQAVQYLVSCFANAVKNGLGNNDERCLMLPGYAASNSNSILSSITVPVVNGEPVKNVIASIHCYSPYNFCLSDNQKTFDPTNAGDTADIDRTFNSIKDIFLDNGIPAVIGETSATAKNNTEEREKWAYYMGSKSAAFGVPIVIWDNGNDSNSGGESHAYFDRKSGADNYPSVTENLMKGYADVTYGSALSGTASGSEGPKSSYVADASLIYENKEGLVSKKDWDAPSFLTIGAKPEYIKSGGDVIVVSNVGDGAALILDSESCGVWWIQIDPTRTEEKDGKKFTYFSYEDIMAKMKEKGVSSPSQLRNFMIVSNGGCTLYEVCATGTNTAKNYMAMGVTYASGDTLPETDPTYTNMKFAGWYTTKTYEAGTEYTGGECDSTNIYAKFELDVDKAVPSK